MKTVKEELEQRLKMYKNIKAVAGSESDLSRNEVVKSLQKAVDFYKKGAAK